MRNLALHDGVSLRVNNLSAQHEDKKEKQNKQMIQTRKKEKKRKKGRERPEMRKKQRKRCGAKTAAWGK